MNAWAVFAAVFGLVAFSVLVLILAARGRDGHWARRRELRRWVTPPHTTHARFVAGQQWTDDTGRPA